MATAQGYNATQGGQLYQGSCPVPLSQFPAPTPRCYDPKTHGQTIAVAGAHEARKGTRARQAGSKGAANKLVATDQKGRLPQAPHAGLF
jgi:hypothetical protein